MRNPSVNAERFREHAAWSRDLAGVLADGDQRQHLLEVADRYDRIADQLALTPRLPPGERRAA
jgi:hypothetical protein